MTHQNVKSPFLQELLQFGIENHFIIILIQAAPSGNWKDEDDILLSAADREALFEYTELSPYIRTDMDSTYKNYECPAGTEILYIKSDGEISGCPFVPIYPGNVKNEDLSELREKVLDSGIYKKNTCVAGTGEFRSSL